jgi:hypothetical protein
VEADAKFVYTCQVIASPSKYFADKQATDLKYEGIHLQVMTVTKILYNILKQQQQRAQHNHQPASFCWVI